MMKKLEIFTTFTLVFYLAFSFYSCKNFSTETKKAEEKSAMVTEEFEAEFIGNYVYVGPDTLPTQKCTDSLSTWRAIVDCKGTSNIMGDIKIHFDFCALNFSN